MPLRVTPEATLKVPLPDSVPEKELAPGLENEIDPAPSVTVPAPVSAPMVSVVPFRSRVAPASTCTVTASAMALPPASFRVPALTVTVPLKVLVPDSVNSPVPALVRAPVPEITPE